MKAADYLELPARRHRHVPVSLPAMARERYRALEKEFLAEIGDDDTVVAQTAAALAGKLLQCANGAVYVENEDGDDGGERRWAFLHGAKREALEDLVEAVNGEPLLVAYHFRSDRDRILEAFPDAVPIDAGGDVIDRWNAGGIPMLVAHPASAGHGLNLQ